MTRTLALAVLLLACNGDKSIATATASGSSTGTPSTGTPTGTPTTLTGTPGTGTPGGTQTGTLPLTVVFADAQCGAGAVQPPGILTATASGPGAIHVVHEGFAVGCCPEFQASARVDLAATEVQLAYTIVSDDCDCACLLDAVVDVEGIPAGTWTVAASGVTDVVTVN